MQPSCDCIKVRNGCMTFAAALWIAWQSPYFLGDHFFNLVARLFNPQDVPFQLFAWLALAILGGIFIKQGMRAAIYDGDTMHPGMALIGTLIAVWGLSVGETFGLPKEIIYGVYVTMLGACYGNMMIYLSARPRRIRILRQEGAYSVAYNGMLEENPRLKMALLAIGADKPALMLPNPKFTALLTELRRMPPAFIEGKVVA
jgi:hypothetical protein